MPRGRVVRRLYIVEEGAGRLRRRLVWLFFCGRRLVDALFSCSVLICLLQCLRYGSV